MAECQKPHIPSRPSSTAMPWSSPPSQRKTPQMASSSAASSAPPSFRIGSSRSPDHRGLHQHQHHASSSHSRPPRGPSLPNITMSPSSSSSASFVSSVDRIVQKTAYNRNLDAGNSSLWLHGHMCKLIISAFIRFRHTLNDPLVLDAAGPRSERNLESLKPAMDNLLKVMLECERFVDWCKCPRQIRKGQDQELVWMRKALSRGLSVEPAETHLHDFMLAVCILRDAIRVNAFSLESDAPLVSAIDHHLSPSLHRNSSNSTASSDQSFRRLQMGRIQLPPDKFWEDEDARDPAYVLLEGDQLDHARNKDISQMEADLNNILRNHASEGDDFKADLARLLQEKIKDYQQQSSQMFNIRSQAADAIDSSDVDAVNRHGGGDGSSSNHHRYPDLTPNFYGDFRDIEMIERIYPPPGSKPADLDMNSHGIREIHKVRWRPAGPDDLFALKLFWGGAKAYFEIEAPIHLRLHHPNIVQSFCVFRDLENERKCGLLMELMPMNLTQFLEKCSDLNLVTKVYIMLQIAKGMAYLQSKGFIHRDLKPENVLVNEVAKDPRNMYSDPYRAEASSSSSFSAAAEFPVVKIADFNTVRTIQVEPDSHVTKQVGTSIYRAPEVMNVDEDGSYCESVDVYSFAMVSFKILSGTEAFPGEPMKTKMRMLCSGKRPDVAQELSGCPAYLQRCLETWWDPLPDKRPSFKEICRVLRHLHGALVRNGVRFLARDVQAKLDTAVWIWVQEKAKGEMQKLEAFCRGDGRRHRCEHSVVSEIPYEMYIMSWLEMALDKHLQQQPPMEKKTKPKSGVSAFLASCFGFCMSETPRPHLGDAV